MVTVGNAANCTFAFVVDTAIANQVLFSFVPNSSASQILWDFGDGSAGMGANAQHVYPVPGVYTCLLYTSPSPRDRTRSRMPSSA